MPSTGRPTAIDPQNNQNQQPKWSREDLIRAVDDVERELRQRHAVYNIIHYSRSKQEAQQQDIDARLERINAKKSSILQAMASADYKDFWAVAPRMREVDKLAVNEIAMRQEASVTQRLLSTIVTATNDVNRAKSFDPVMDRIFKDSAKMQETLNGLLGRYRAFGIMTNTMLRDADKERQKVREWFRKELEVLGRYLDDVHRSYGMNMRRLGVPESRRVELESNFRPLFIGYEI